VSVSTFLGSLFPFFSLFRCFFQVRSLTHELLLFLPRNPQSKNRYVEQYAADGKAAASLDAQEALGPIIKVALETSKLREFTGREKPTVIT